MRTIARRVASARNVYRADRPKGCVTAAPTGGRTEGGLRGKAYRDEAERMQREAWLTSKRDVKARDTGSWRAIVAQQQADLTARIARQRGET